MIKLQNYHRYVFLRLSYPYDARILQNFTCPTDHYILNIINPIESYGRIIYLPS